MSLNSETRSQIIAALQDGQKLSAIKIYRDATGSDLASAKEFIEHLQVAIETGENPLRSDSGNETSPELIDEIVNLMSRREVIPAIKKYREQHAVGLKEAKDAVYRIAREAGIDVPEPKGCVTTAALMLALVTWSVFRLLA